MAHKRVKEQSSWISRAKFEIEHEEEILACRLIVLRIVRFMKDNRLSQKDLAERLNVSPQYINKFLNGGDLDMKLSTVFRYERALGIKLIDIHTDAEEAPKQQQFINTRFDNIACISQPISFNYDWESSTIQLKRFKESTTFSTKRNKLYV